MVLQLHTPKVVLKKNKKKLQISFGIISLLIPLAYTFILYKLYQKGFFLQCRTIVLVHFVHKRHAYNKLGIANQTCIHLYRNVSKRTQVLPEKTVYHNYVEPYVLYWSIQ